MIGAVLVSRTIYYNCFLLAFMASSVLLLRALPWLLRRVMLRDFFYRIIELIPSSVQSVHRRQVALLIEAILRTLEEVYLIGLAAFLNSHCLHLRLAVPLKTCQRSLVQLHWWILGDERPFFLGLSAVNKGIVALSILVVVEILSLPYNFNSILVVELPREIDS